MNQSAFGELDLVSVSFEGFSAGADGSHSAQLAETHCNLGGACWEFDLWLQEDLLLDTFGLSGGSVCSLTLAK